ncbi:hypothetical protein F5Y09DRAFT_230802 [Xylaria sp. FL1042]|nr:hypothetical protein F5Y09DRAFT_230802 [Xylaria sp. FL1042]
MAPVGSSPALSPVVTSSSHGERGTPAGQALPTSRSWKNKFQKHVNSWKRQNGSGTHAGSASSGTPDPDHNFVISATRSGRILSQFRSGLSNTPSSPNQVPSLQSVSQDSLTSASLFSRNSYPSVFSAGTDATSTSGVLTACGVTCSVDSPFVKLYKRMKNNLMVYVARDDVEIPLDVVEQWETTDLDRLKTDLSEVVMEIYRKGVDRESRRRRSALCIASGHHEYDISFELRMSGRATREAHQVSIGPSIWLICGSTWACKEISAAMEEITWPTLPVEIHEGRVPIPSIAEGKVDIEKLDLTDGCHLGDGVMLYIHVEESCTDTTSCGLLCCMTIKDGDTYSHNFSRIGGLVMATNTLKSSQFGVSTAHGMLDQPWWHRHLRKRNSVATWDCQSVESTDDSDEYDYDRDITYDDQEEQYSELPAARERNSSLLLDDSEFGEGYRDPQLVSRWRNVTHHGLLSFLGATVKTENKLQLHYDGTETDHAMIQLDYPQDTSPRSWNNKYRPKRAPSGGSIDIATHISNKDLSKGEVSIICQADSPIDGYLLPGSTCLAMGGRMFTLRKLKTAAPVARGVSGCWVARGTELCGMVIAVSNPEPYVYMMRAEDLISNLGTSSPSIETIEVFNSQRRKAKHEPDRTVLQRWPTRTSQHRLGAVVASSKVSIDEQPQAPGIKRSLSASLRALGSSRRSHDLYRKSDAKPRRSRSVYNMLSATFSTKIEEIVQPAHRDGADIKRISELRRPIGVSGRILGYYPVQAKRRPLPGTTRRLRASLEPILETSLDAAVGVDSILDSKYVYLQSTAYAPATAFRHGPIRLNKSDLVPGEDLDIDVDEECPEYEFVLSRTARDWLSGNYESQQEEQVDEIQDLIDWWESWGIEEPGLITEQAEERCSSLSTASDDFPGVSYSDTTSEDSIGSCHGWANYPTSAAQGYFPKYSYEYVSEDIERSSAEVLSEGISGRPSFGALKGFTGLSDEICKVDCIPDLMA